MIRIFRLKNMVLARLMAEMTVAIILIFLPVAVWLVPKFQALPFTFKLVIFVLAIMAVCMLPFYGFITWRVKVDDKGITAFALFKKQFVEWSKLTGIKLKSSLSWRRYVIDFEGGDLNFPVWLENQKDLLEIIRNKIPSGISLSARSKIFRQGNFDLAMQFARIVLNFLFIVIFWYFYLSLKQSKHIGAADLLMILAACIVLTGLMLWRSLVIATMPRLVELTKDELIVQTCFFKKQIPWTQITKLATPFFLLPEGMMIKTKMGSFLITNSLDDVDDLEVQLQERLSKSK